eukprot:4077730-Prorocentrum_lima.AAC.1
MTTASAIGGKKELGEGCKELPGPFLLLGVCPPFRDQSEHILECLLHGLVDLLWDLAYGGGVEEENLLECNLVPPIQG